MNSILKKLCLSTLMLTTSQIALASPPITYYVNNQSSHTLKISANAPWRGTLFRNITIPPGQRLPVFSRNNSPIFNIYGVGHITARYIINNDKSCGSNHTYSSSHFLKSSFTMVNKGSLSPSVELTCNNYSCKVSGNIVKSNSQESFTSYCYSPKSDPEII